MFLKRERPETDDFAIKIYLIVGKILIRNFNISRNARSVRRHPYTNIH